MITNIHERTYRASVRDAGALIDGLSSPNDRLWPHHRWPAMKFDRPLGVDAKGGHGPIRYFVETYEPGRSVRFRFTGPKEFHGTHRFELEDNGGGSVTLRHVIEMTVTGTGWLTWLLAIRWLHDALLEDALDQAASVLEGTPCKEREWGVWVKCLRRAMAPRPRPH